MNFLMIFRILPSSIFGRTSRHWLWVETNEKFDKQDVIDVVECRGDNFFMSEIGKIVIFGDIEN